MSSTSSQDLRVFAEGGPDSTASLYRLLGELRRLDQSVLNQAVLEALFQAVDPIDAYFFRRSYVLPLDSEVMRGILGPRPILVNVYIEELGKICSQNFWQRLLLLILPPVGLHPLSKQDLVDASETIVVGNRRFYTETVLITGLAALFGESIYDVLQLGYCPSDDIVLSVYPLVNTVGPVSNADELLDRLRALYTPGDKYWIIPSLCANKAFTISELDRHCPAVALAHKLFIAYGTALSDQRYIEHFINRVDARITCRPAS